ncbi:MAG: cytochrome b [Parvularculales bacterium]
MQKDYAIVQKVIHWIMGIFIILDLFIAQKFGDFIGDPDGFIAYYDETRFASLADHATMGYILATLFVLRLYFRHRHGGAELPSGMPRWQVLAAHAGHIGLYVLMGVLLLSGIITASAASQPIVIFGFFDAAFGAADESFFQSVRLVHETCTNLIIALIVIHIVAALYHHFIVRDRTMLRMLLFWKKTQL